WFQPELAAGVRRAAARPARAGRSAVRAGPRPHWIIAPASTPTFPLTPPHSAGSPFFRRDQRVGPLVPARALDADQPVRHGLVALEVLREGRDVVQVVQVDDVAA